jgi:hypothetical protein
MTGVAKARDVLVKFEEENLPEEYKEYYATKRNNLFATIEGAPALWAAFILLDKIWIRELQNMRTAIDTSRMFPLILFMNAHAKIRIAMELGLSACLPEAYSISRDAIESVAHGHRMFFDPELQKLWVSKDTDPAALHRFMEEFWYSKEDKLFDGLPELYHLWKQYSEFGSHTNPVSIVSRFVINETPKHLEWRLNYTGVDPRVLIPAVFTMLLAFHVMEGILFNDCLDRLKFDHELVTMRSQFEAEKEKLRRTIIKVFNIPPPTRAKPF